MTKGSGVRKIRVLVVDDSAIVRRTLTDILAAEQDIEVVGTAPDPFIARDKIVMLQPDVLTLDIEMPRMDGLTFLRKIMQHHPMPVIVISSLGSVSCDAALQALRSGAVDFIPKPGGPYSVGDLRRELAAKVRGAASASIRTEGGAPGAPAAAVSHPPSAPAPVAVAPSPVTTPHFATTATSGSQLPLIAIGASTGGTEAIRQILSHLPPNLPPIVITQHMPPVFSRSFANNLNSVCPFPVKEAEDGDFVDPGTALVAPGDYHMVIRRAGSRFRVALTQTPRVCYQRPAVDVMFQSVAEAVGNHAVGVLLTGMGSDGAQGLKRMQERGAITLAQDEQSCVVFGMPRAAIALGAADHIVSLDRMPRAIVEMAAARSDSAPAPKRTAAEPALHAR